MAAPRKTRLETVETTPGVPADRKTRAPRRRPAVAAAPDTRSLVEITSTPEDEEAAPLPVFSIDGVVHTMPARIPASLALEALDRFRHEGELSATAWMLEEVLGTESYRALKSCRALNSDQLQAIMAKVSEHVMGELESTGK